MAKVLVVDDNPANRSLIVTLLEHCGHHALQASDGAQALDIARREQPQLIVSDVLMPVMDGFELVRQLRLDGRLAHIEVIFWSAHYHEREARDLATACGVTCVLPKPSEPENLLAAVEDALARSVQTMRAPQAGDFNREHLRLMTDKLSEKVQELSRINARLEAEIAERKQAQEKTDHLNRVYAVLSGINSLIVRVRDRDELFREACRLAVEHGRFLLAWIGWLDEKNGDVKPVAWAGDDQGYVRLARISPDKDGERLSSVVVTAIQSRQPAVCNDIETEAHRLLNGPEMLARGYRSVAALPLIVGEQPVGALALYAHEYGFFDEAEMALLKELCGDISFALDHLEKAERLNFLAYYDSLTGIANRTLFHERLTQAVNIAGRGQQKLAVIVMDLDRFETVNDTYGRHLGDQLLKQLAVRLVQNVGDPGQVARIGATLFAALVVNAQQESEVLHLLESWWRSCFDTPFVIDDIELLLAARGGIALFPNDGRTADTLLRNADAALKRAKATADGYLLYTQEMSERMGKKLALENKLRRALQNEEFVLYYQPKVDLDARRIQGVEALIRWHSPDLGLVPPGDFIGLMEETGMIVEVGAWVIHQSNVDRAHWIERKLQAPRVAVNVSTVQLRRQDFVRTMAGILKTAKPEAGIDIEVTESLIMEDVDAHIQKLREIRALGVGIAIDDFGTGYSSLGYLAKLPAQTLKIDRSFIVAMLDDPDAMTLVSTMISLAHSLRMQVVAEGVESEEQAKILRLLRCDQMQGYLIGKPQPFDELCHLLQAENQG